MVDDHGQAKVLKLIAQVKKGLTGKNLSEVRPSLRILRFGILFHHPRSMLAVLETLSCSLLLDIVKDSNLESSPTVNDLKKTSMSTSVRSRICTLGMSQTRAEGMNEMAFRGQ